MSINDHLTGIDDRVSDMLNLLDCDSSGVRLVVLHGMGGIEKTTLASVVFNKLLSQFEGSSFISNVCESATVHGGIAKLQNKLSGDILGGQYARSCNFDDGYGEMIQRIQVKTTFDNDNPMCL
ncbi:hypothetical protein MLD38_036767 [Melastoma candidum]|uniref:Uncharacterized protein n=1 Tax=Melastoma candidum TaxID=119954 RepID=A0ACB9LLP3_9MYRT|nr:hypothetical protein MLD38_036767 [Melastoma candidum]